MTSIFNDEFNRVFKRMSNTFFNINDIFEEFKENNSNIGPYYYGYSMTIGPNGKPVVREYGNIKPGPLPTSDTREPIIDTIIDEKGKLVKLVAEMPGVEKADVKIIVQGNSVDISAEHDQKKYHVKVPIKYKIDESSTKASYKNGILELIFKQLEDEKPKSKKVEVE